MMKLREEKLLARGKKKRCKHVSGFSPSCIPPETRERKKREASRTIASRFLFQSRKASRVRLVGLYNRSLSIYMRKDTLQLPPPPIKSSSLTGHSGTNEISRFERQLLRLYCCPCSLWSAKCGVNRRTLKLAGTGWFGVG